MFALYLQRRDLIGDGEAIIETLAGPIRSTVLDDGRVRVHMGTARFNSPSIDSVPWGPDAEIVERELEADGVAYNFTFVDVGNPHCIIVCDSLEAVDLERVGPSIENHPLFPHRTNVEFIQWRRDDSVSMRVWERGVGETQACGTGATAVGAAAVRLGLAGSPVTVHLLGGDLEIEAADDGQVVMIGTADEVFTGRLSRDLLTRLDWAGDDTSRAADDHKE